MPRSESVYQLFEQRASSAKLHSAVELPHMQGLSSSSALQSRPTKNGRDTRCRPLRLIPPDRPHPAARRRKGHHSPMPLGHSLSEELPDERLLHKPRPKGHQRGDTHNSGLPRSRQLGRSLWSTRISSSPEVPKSQFKFP